MEGFHVAGTGKNKKVIEIYLRATEAKNLSN